MTDSPADTLTGQAQQTLAQIEQRVAYILLNMRLAVRILLDRPHQSTPPALQAADLELHAEHWRALVPKDDEGRAALLQVMAQRYALSPEHTPKITAALGADNTAVQAEYERLYGQPIASAFRRKTAQDELSLDTFRRVMEELVVDDLGSALEWVLLRRGETLFHEGDPADSLYVIVSGLLRAVVTNEDGQEVVVNELGRGDTVGEMGAITGEARSAAVYAVRDSELCKFSKAAFERLAENYPGVMTRIAVQMMNRLRRISHAKVTYNRPVTVAVLPVTSGVSDYIARLAAACEAQGATLHLNRERLPDEIGANDERVDDAAFVSWLNEREMQHRFVFYEADMGDTAWTRRCLQQADRVLLVARADADPNISTLDAMLKQMESPRARIHGELVLIHPDRSRMPSGTRTWLDLCRIDQHYHVAEHDGDDLARVVRFISGTAVGLVLGAGGMRGSTHIGVLKALNELGIRADYVGGCSAGALIAAQYALGWSIDQMLQIGEQELVKKRALKDLTLPLVAFNEGKRLTQAYQNMLGDVRIEDLWLPYFCISANMTTAGLNVHRDGLLWRAVRASTALPGVYPPVLDENGDILIDGSIFNSVPADVMRTFIDGGTVIAVDVGRELSGKRNFRYGDTVNGWALLLNRLNPLAKKTRVPGILRILTRSAALNGVSARSSQVAAADLLLKPPIENFGLFDMKGYMEIYEIGYQHAMDKVMAWQARG